MGKKKGPAWNFFKSKDKGVVCKYCSKRYRYANVNKMTNHIKKCFKCPSDLKKHIQSQSLTEIGKSFPPRKLQEPLVVEVSNELGFSHSRSSENRPMPSCSSSAGSEAEVSWSEKRPATILSFIDNMDISTNEMLNQSLAKAIFISGSPISLVDHPLWIEFFKQIRPAYILPSRFRLGSTYLEGQYSEMQAEVGGKLQNSKHLHLQCDGWTNLRNESIINFIISTPEPLFVDFVMAKENKHNSTYLSQQISVVMEKHDPQKFLVVIGDNAANMRAAFRSLKDQFPHIVPLGCLAHLLHLLCSDILGCQSIKLFLNSAVDVVKTVKQSHILQALFNRIGKEKQVTISLKLPGKTRWGSHLSCFQSLLINKVVLQTLAVSEEANLSTELKKKLLDDGVFWVRIEKMVNLLKPIVDLINKMQSNEPQIHSVFSEFENLQATLNEQLPVSPLQKVEEQLILKKFLERKEFGLGHIHLAADLLNPASQGCELGPIQLIDAISFICDVGQHMGLNKIQLRTDLANYRDKDGLWARKFVWEGVGIMSPILWWRGLRGTNELVEVAIKILSAPVTSAATERSFSTFSWIHSKKRNRLKSEKAAKLTYLAYNWKLLNQIPLPKPGLDECEPNESTISTKFSKSADEKNQKMEGKEQNRKVDSETEEFEDEPSSSDSDYEESESLSDSDD